MKTIIALGLFIITLLGHVPADAETSVWVAKSGGQTVYLGGAMHLLRPSDFPLPAEFDRAYQQSDAVIFETDLGKMNDPATMQQMLTALTYTDGRTLDKVLSPKAYKALTGYCEKIGVPIASLHPYKPSFAMLSLWHVELQRFGATQDGVDMHFYEKAIADQKSIKGLETVDKHLEYLAYMGEGNEDAFILQSLKDFKRMHFLLSRMTAAWRNGHDTELDQIFVADMKKDFPKLHQKLLVERNQHWLPIIESYLKTPATEFVLVGAAHLVGEEGLVQQLTRRGYTVSKLH